MAMTQKKLCTISLPYLALRMLGFLEVPLSSSITKIMRFADLMPKRYYNNERLLVKRIYHGY